MIKAAAILAIFLLTACSGSLFEKYAPKAPKTPEVTVSQKGAVSLSGAAKVPSEVATSSTESEMEVPEGSTFVFNEKLGTMALTLSKATRIALNRTESTVKGPVAFDPPKTPTASELANAESDSKIKAMLYIGLVAGVAAGIFGLVRAWDVVMIAGGCSAAACGFGLMIAKSVNDHPWISHVVVAGVVASLVAVGIYFFKIKPHEQAKLNAGG